MNPTVRLIAHTERPVETIYQIWELSKSNRPFEGIHEDAFDIERPDRARAVFEKVVDAKIPVAENLNFVFLLENVSISFREQMVRHRIGVNVGERIGIDMVPDLADSTWWSQSMRILDMSAFADEKAYRIPKFPNRVAEERYHRAMRDAQDAYKALAEQGMSLEDAREVIPLGATHRITWGLNLAALQHIIGKRGCWILQGDLWEPIIRGMVDELATKVDPYFRRLVAPPCIKGGNYVGCQFKIDNERRVKGEDEIPPCSLYLGEEHVEWKPKTIGQETRFHKMMKQYSGLWGRGPMHWNAEPGH